MFIKNDFRPDYENIVAAARNQKPARLPLYEHVVSGKVMEAMIGKPDCEPAGGEKDMVNYYKYFNGFFKQMGYDTICFEVCVGGFMPGSGALGGHKAGVIKTRGDFEKYEWDSIPGIYMERSEAHFRTMAAALPDGMKNVGGVGNGVFECVQDIVGFNELCYIKYDDPELFSDLFVKVGDMLYKIWGMVTDKYDDMFCVYRFGDDLGYKQSPMLAPDDVITHIVPQYKRIISLIKSKTKKPFLLHSCGNIFSVMDNIIGAGIDAKHSNEDVIAPFSEWISRYNDRIGLFGGIDTDALCDVSGINIDDYVKEHIEPIKDFRGIAVGSGNSIPDYVSPDRYARMNELVRIMRGE